MKEDGFALSLNTGTPGGRMVLRSQNACSRLFLYAKHVRLLRSGSLGASFATRTVDFFAIHPGNFQKREATANFSWHAPRESVSV